jgi:hypothetical protein
MLPPRLIVANIPLNASIPFWKQNIGRRGIRISVGADGLWEILLDGDPLPVEGVDPSRFRQIRWPLRDRIMARIRLAWRWFTAPLE